MMPRLVSLAASLAAALLLAHHAEAMSVLFDFDGGPLGGSTPLGQSAGGVNALFSGAGVGYSIQRADALGFTPAGMSGYVLYPNSVFQSDLSIAFDHSLTDISLLYAPEEYATDSSATIRLTAYLGSSLVGTSTATADPPGTWPTATLAFSSLQPFDNVVVHYDSPPPTGGDYGPIFIVDNVAVTTPEPPLLATAGLVLAGLGLLWRRASAAP